MQQPRQMYQEGGIMPRLNELGSGVSSAEQILQGITQRLESAESSLGEGGGNTSPIGSGFMQPVSMSNSQAPDLRAIPEFMKDASYQPKQSPIGNGFYDNNAGLGNQLPFLGRPVEGMTSQISQLGSSPISAAMRNMAASGGMMGRQNYGLGSFVKKAVKGVTGAVKSIAKSDIGKAALIGGLGMYAGGLGPFGAKGMFSGAKGAGFLGNMFSGGLPGLNTAKDFFGGEKTLGKTAAMFAGGTLLGSLASAAESGDEEAVAATRDVNALRSYLEKGYRNLNYSEDEIPALVESDVAEYSAGQGGYANGGRIGYAFGTPEQNAIEAAGIMNLPLNQNPAGVTELDLRKTGGFIPPVGVKEKADDIPAMLANNEFVFTADAVRGMGDGNVNKGAQRMYDMMKKLEKGGRV